MGSFDEAFLDIPPEVIRTTIRANQKCFVLRDPSTGKLANKFLLTSNLVATDGGKTIVGGNERVVRARLSDAKFFWETDRKVKLEDRLEKLKSIVFHEKLGTQYERVERIAALAKELAPHRRRRSGAGGARRASRQGRSRHRDGRRIPRAAGPDGPLLRDACRASTHPSPRRSRSTTSRSARPTACRPIRSRSPWRSPTRSTRSWASGPSTRSRRDRRILTRCGVRRWA